MMAEDTSNILKLLCSSAKIDRDRGLSDLLTYLKDADDNGVRHFETAVQNLLENPDIPWETKHGSLMGTKALLEKQCKYTSDGFVCDAKRHALKFLEDGESRVRLAAGEVMGVLCSRNGTDVYVCCKDKILEGVKSNLERQPLTEAALEEQKQTEHLVEKLAAPQGLKRRGSNDAEQIFHDTAGWKNLETWMKCLQVIIDSCGPAFNQFVDQDLLNLIFQALSHTNRFVRETGYYVCASLVSCNYTDSGEEIIPPEQNAIYQNGQQFATQLAKGMADNWSQVRLAGSVATRKFLLGLPGEEARQKFYKVILPPLCLNRYYVAEGVRIYNQETWRQTTHGDGRHLVEMYITDVVDFYISQTEADNHAVREAACACIAELGHKIDKDAVRPHVPRLLDALLVCFKDQSWPVRDASCVACGNFVLCFPEESRSKMDDLYPLFYENLQDNIPSVRQGAAMALGNVIKAYGKDAMERVLDKVREGLSGVEGQPANTEKYNNMEKAPATYGVVKRLRDNDMELHTDMPMFSCGSLAPKMGRGKRAAGGCMDHMFRRPAEPWELADGCLDLTGSMSQIPEAVPEVTKLLPLVVKAVSFHHYTQHVHFLENMCDQLPVIAKGIGKRAFKMHLEMLFDAIFYSLDCDNALTANAARQCINELSTLIGPNIFRGRVEQYNPRYLEHLPPMGQFGPPP